MSLEDEIAKTQEVLQPLLQRPQLKEKFLSKPPFRFLHDIVTGLLKATGFGEGLYEETELDSGNLKDREGKVEFLRKLILVIGICRGTKIDVREGKIVAGLEPEKTNIMLQELAYAARDDDIDFPEASRLALSGAEPGTVPRKRGAKDEAPEVVAEVAAVEAKQEPPRKRRESGEAKFAAEEAKASTIPRGDASLDEMIAACDGQLETTRSILEPIIERRPKLSDKLLSKPPFRFLHDIISEVIRRTGFADDLFDDVESDSTQVVDKAAKIQYLTKIITLVGTQLETMIEARPAKIVSGLEAENTNRFLQLLGVAANQRPDTTANVRAILSSGTTTTQPPPQDSGPPLAAAAAAVEEEEPLKIVPAAEPKQSIAEDVPMQPAKEQPQEKGDAPAQTLANIESKFNSEDAQPKRSMRPVTARRKPPKYKENTEEDAKAPVAKPAIIMDNDNEDDDDEPVAAEEKGFDDAKISAAPAQGKSKLVREIQEEERKAKEKSDKAASESKPAAAAEKTTSGIRFGRIDRAVAKADKYGDTDLDALMATIQTLCQSTSPLGKCMDYVHEDLSTMNKELDKWKLEYRDQKDILDRERDMSLEAMKPLHMKLKDLDDQINHEIQQTRDIKARILKHEARVKELVMMVCTATYDPQDLINKYAR